MKETTKRILSLVLAFVMVLGLLPGLSVNVSAAEGVIDAAIFCSDVHGSTSDLTSVLGGVAKSGVDYSSIGLVGDTDLTVANTTNIVQSALSDTDIQVMFSYASSHDGSDIANSWDYSGEVEGVSENYLVYTIRETDMQNASGANTAAPAFTTWYNGLTEAEKALPIFILSHRPLHDRRDDNAGAATWYDAISAAAESSDIVFFWGHNHTGESSVDTAAYYVAKDGTETFTVYNGSTVTPNFTYMNAGYINANNQNPARKGVATTVQITADSLIFQDYNSSGAYTGSNAHNVQVAREFAAETEVATLSAITISGTTEYTVGDELALTVTATYSDGTTADVTAEAALSGYDMATAGTQTVTATYEGLTATIDITVTAVQINSIAVTTQPDKLTYTTGEELDTTGMVVTATYNNGTTAEITGWYVSAVDMTTVGEKTVTVNYMVDGITYKTTFTITVEEGVAEGVVLESIEITRAPDKTEYLISQELALDGMVVVATFSDGSTVELAYKPFSTSTVYGGYELDNFSMYVEKNHEMKVTYTFGEVTCTDTTTINVWNEDFTDDATGVKVHVGEDDYGVTAVTVSPSSNSHVAAAMQAYMMDGTLVAYDITLALDAEVSEDGEAVYGLTDAVKTVTLPIPAGVNNPVVYYVSDDGETVTNMNAVKDGSGNVTFETTHFSTYVIGESAEIELPENQTASGSGTATTKEEKTVYVLVSTPTAGNQYIIVSSGSAGTGYALKENTTTGSSITINAAGNGISAPYIETTDETIMWNTASGMTFQSENGGYYLRYSSGLSFSTRSSTDWTVGTNTAYTYSSSRYRYLYNNDGTWTTSSSRNTSTSYKAYFYEKQTVEVETTTTVSGTYSIAGEDVTAVVVEGTTKELTSTLTFTPDSGSATTEDVSATATYDIVTVDANGNTVNGDPNGIIEKFENGVVTFTGSYGEALVKVSYTTDFGVVTDYITITATEPTYSIEITEADEIVTDTIIVKGVEANDTHELWAKLFYTDENGQQEKTLDASKLTWASNDTSIATVNADGTVIFTGEEGNVQITAYYAYADGKQATDTITISVSKFSYVVPGDGTDDFPEYPNQGAIRIDKTAVAQGTFSQTGIAKVELSMTGVPYGTSAKTDVILMVDMTSSMETNDITAAKLAAQELIESLVYDEENDAYDENIHLFVSSFSSGTSTSNIVITDHLDDVTISNSDELTAAKNAITDSTNGFRDDRHSTTGTHYGVALADVYETLNREGAAENQYVVFVTDGVPTRYYYLNSSGSYTEVTGSNSDSQSLAAGWFDDDGEVTDSFQTEYYTYLIKGMGVPVYTIGANLSTGSDASDLINHMSSNYSPDGKTATGETKYSFTCTTSGGVTDEVLEIFAGIGQDIREAAVNVVVEDKIADEYTVNFSLPSGVTADEAGMDDFYIQVLGYDLDENNERKVDPEILEKFLFDSNGTITHTIGSNACGDTCTHVTYTDGVVTAIDGTYFDYASSAKGEFLTWNAEKLDRTELALEYFVYLDNSAGYPAAEQVAPGTYDTNEYAHITYTNFNGNECRQYFPVPSLTWNGAQVTYVFYLVNDDGQPVNRAGKIIPFAEAVYVTDPVTYDVTWNEEAGTENLLAENLFASANVPDVYSLYDEQAYYEIRVYQTEGVDGENAVNYNYFTISGAADKLIDSAMDSDTTVDNSTTKVFNTKAGTKYDEYGIYSAQSVGTKLNTTDIDGNPTVVTTTVKTTDIDYANTTVAFAVVWKPELVEDVVVVDYGLDVVIDVYSNDGLAAGVTGVMLNAPANIGENNGTYSDAVGEASVTSVDGLWTASRENMTSVRFHMNEMGISNAVKFYYEAGVNYYTYDSSGKATLTTTNMYSSVTVIPATTIYYEDNFVELSIWDMNDEKLNEEWAVVGTTVNDTQDQDRPGDSKISDAIDADNIYGYDSAYTDCAMYSMGSARVVTVDDTRYAEAQFTFYGTGFDIISLTSNTSGTISVDVFTAEEFKENGYAGTTAASTMVDTYYGFIQDDEGNWVVDDDANGSLYQVPVMKISDLEYDQYTVIITVAYHGYFDHRDAGKLDFFLDAIRIYDPTGNQDDTSNDAYLLDGEAWPVYQELRNNVIESADDAGHIAGAVYIDGVNDVFEVEDYTSWGPNNELYLAPGDAIVFSMSLGEYLDALSALHIGLKSANGGDVAYHIFDAADIQNRGDVTALQAMTVTTSTDMYYDITALKDSTIVIFNSSENDAILSITNLKATFTKNPGDVDVNFSIIDSEALTALLTALNTAAPDEEESTEPTESTDPTEGEDSGSGTGSTIGKIIDWLKRLLGLGN